MAISATGKLVTDKVPAEQAAQAEATARKQLGKTGESVFVCTAVELAWDRPYFLPVRVLNALRRETLERLGAEREANRPLMTGAHMRNDVPFPESDIVLPRQRAEPKGCRLLPAAWRGKGRTSRRVRTRHAGRGRHADPLLHQTPAWAVRWQAQERRPARAAVPGGPGWTPLSPAI